MTTDHFLSPEVLPDDLDAAYDDPASLSDDDIRGLIKEVWNGAEREFLLKRERQELYDEIVALKEQGQ